MPKHGRFSKSLRPRKPEGSLGRTAQDGHLDSHTASELCDITKSKKSVLYVTHRAIHITGSRERVLYVTHHAVHITRKREMVLYVTHRAVHITRSREMVLYVTHRAVHITTTKERVFKRDTPCCSHPRPDHHTVGSRVASDVNRAGRLMAGRPLLHQALFVAKWTPLALASSLWTCGPASQQR